MISAADVKALREKTNAGMMDCKKALVEFDGDMEKAAEYLKEKGLAFAAKKADRVTAEGIVESYIHGGGRIGVLVEINCETDFVANTPEYKELCRDIAMHIAASSPKFIKRDEISADIIEKEREVFRAQALEEGKPEKIVEKIVEGKIDKYFKEVCLMEQPFIKDTDKTVQDLVTDKVAKMGENITVRRFARFQLGEGLAKKECNLAEEVATMKF